MRVSQALKGETIEWDRQDRQRLEALERYAVLVADAVRAGLNQDSRPRLSSPPPSWKQ
jgi:exoribonuclease-2